jgi:hypothetical protein
MTRRASPKASAAVRTRIARTILQSLFLTAQGGQHDSEERVPNCCLGERWCTEHTLYSRFAARRW